MNNKMNTSTHFRHPFWDDLQAVHDMIGLHELAWARTPDDFDPTYTLEDLRANWRRTGFQLEQDAWIAVTPDNQPVGTIGVFAGEKELVSIDYNSCVHPKYVGQGIGTHLLSWAEQRAHALVPEGPLVLTTWTNHDNKAEQRLMQKMGFTACGHSVVGMEIKLSEAPPPPTLPTGFTGRLFIPGQDDQAVFEAVEDAFEMPFTAWETMYVKREDFDATMWYLIWQGDQLAGFIFCDPVPHMGYVDMLGVRKSWRGKGLGKALLLWAFNDTYRRGLKKVVLSVNIQNATGALQLYEKVGMHVFDQIDEYKKTLRPSAT